jgi:hypothetical protein
MSDVKVNSVKPSEVGPAMVAYLLTVATLTGKEYSKGYMTIQGGIPVIGGCTEEEVLRAYAKAYRVVMHPSNVEEILSAL